MKSDLLMRLFYLMLIGLLSLCGGSGVSAGKVLPTALEQTAQRVTCPASNGIGIFR